MDNNKFKEGWGWISNSPKWHYFRDGRSLCGKWFTFQNEFEQGNLTSPDNCVGCNRKALKEAEKEVKVLGLEK